MGKGVDMADKVAVLYFIHFGSKDPDLVTCLDCLDYRLRLCPGGAESVFDCMFEQAESCEFFGNYN